MAKWQKVTGFTHAILALALDLVEEIRDSIEEETPTGSFQLSPEERAELHRRWQHITRIVPAVSPGKVSGRVVQGPYLMRLIVRPEAQTELLGSTVGASKMNEAFESIKAGLQEAAAHTRGEPVKTRIHEFGPMDVKAIRSKVGMSQSEFATSFGISVGTLRHWERGDRQPHGPARVLLTVLAKEPEAVLHVLRA